MALAAAQIEAAVMIKILTIGLGAAVCVLTIELIRRDLLRTAYAMLWLVSSLAVIAIGLFPGLLDRLQRFTGMNYQTAMLFVIFGFVLLLLMQYSIIISRLSNRNKHLAQDVALLRQEMDQLKTPAAAGPAPSHEAPRGPARDAETPGT